MVATPGAIAGHGAARDQPRRPDRPSRHRRLGRHPPRGPRAQRAGVRDGSRIFSVYGKRGSDDCLWLITDAQGTKRAPGSRRRSSGPTTTEQHNGRRGGCNLPGGLTTRHDNPMTNTRDLRTVAPTITVSTRRVRFTLAPLAVNDAAAARSAKPSPSRAMPPTWPERSSAARSSMPARDLSRRPAARHRLQRGRPRHAQRVPVHPA